MYDFEKGILALVFTMTLPILTILAMGGLFALLAFIATIILLIINVVTVFRHPSSRKALALIIFSLLPLLIGLAGSVFGIAGFKILLSVLEQLGFGKIGNATMGYITWFSSMVGGVGTVVNIIPAILGYVLSLKCNEK